MPEDSEAKQNRKRPSVGLAFVSLLIAGLCVWAAVYEGIDLFASDPPNSVTAISEGGRFSITFNPSFWSQQEWVGTGTYVNGNKSVSAISDKPFMMSLGSGTFPGTLQDDGKFKATALVGAEDVWGGYAELISFVCVILIAGLFLIASINSAFGSIGEGLTELSHFVEEQLKEAEKEAKEKDPAGIL
jgi:hypothetical protein